MRRTSWVVEADGREGGKVACFYCKAPVGTEHNAGCVQRTRTVVIEARITLVREVPEDWDSEMVEFQLNGSSWCAGNIIRDLEKINDGDCCLCGQFKGVYKREATPEDEERLGYRAC